MRMFFLDRNMSPGLVPIFLEMSLRATHHSSHFSDTTKDPEIIEYVARNNYILVTYDRKIVRAHRVALREHRPRVVFLTATIGDKKIDEQKKWYRTVWADICNEVENIAANTQIRVTVHGDIRVVWEPPKNGN